MAGESRGLRKGADRHRAEHHASHLGTGGVTAHRARAETPYGLPRRRSFSGGGRPCTVMSSTKCPQCGIVNFADGGACRRCGEEVCAPRAAVAVVHDAEPSPLRRLGAIAGAVAAVLFGWWVSLFATSEGLDL